jgi:predicted aconitase
MFLTREQERMLNGDYGWAVAKAMAIIVKTGEVLGASRLVEISHAHVSGVSYTNILDPGLDFVRRMLLSGGRARVYTTINPGCVDYSGLSSLIDGSFNEKQAVIDESLTRMGFKPVFTCIPYYHRPPSQGEFLAWGESSAVAVANSYYGASSNREGGPLALAAALTGYTYYAGLHIPENRVAKVLVRVVDPSASRNPGALGLWVGENIREIPLVEGFNPTLWDLKIMLAASAASGSHALIVVEKITPRGFYRVDSLEKVEVEWKDLEKYIGLEPSGGSILGYLGCPHLHPREFHLVYEYVKRRGRLPGRNRLLLTIPLEVYERYRDKVLYLRGLGVDVAAGTCPVVSRLTKRFDHLVTNSGKAVFYLSKQLKMNYYLTETRRVLEIVYA